MDIRPMKFYRTLSSEGGPMLGNKYPLVTFLNCLIILSLNFSFACEVWWDNEALRAPGNLKSQLPHGPTSNTATGWLLSCLPFYHTQKSLLSAPSMGLATGVKMFRVRCMWPAHWVKWELACTLWSSVLTPWIVPS